MVAPSSSPTAAPLGVVELTDRVHLLYEPPAGVAACADLVLVHGLNSNEFKCWTNRNNVLWPQQFLPVDFPAMRILSIGYSHHLWGWGGDHRGVEASVPKDNDASAAAAHKEVSVEECGADVFRRLSCAAVGVGCRPIVFVTHSMGGLVTKQMLVQQFLSLDQEAHRFLDQVEAVVFYATPHFGSPIASVVSGLEYFVGRSVRLSGVVTALGDHNVDQLTALNRQFLRVADKKDIHILSFAEGKKLNGLVMVVDAVSANPAPGFPQHAFHVIDEDHTRLNTPDHPSEPSYTILRDFIAEYLFDDEPSTNTSVSVPVAASSGRSPDNISVNVNVSPTSWKGDAMVDSLDPAALLSRRQGALLSRRSLAMVRAEVHHVLLGIEERCRKLFGVVQPTDVSAVREILAELHSFAANRSVSLATTSVAARSDASVADGGLGEDFQWVPLSFYLYWSDAFARMMDGMWMLRCEAASLLSLKRGTSPSSTGPSAAVSHAPHQQRLCAFRPREVQQLQAILTGLRTLEAEWRALHRAVRRDNSGSHKRHRCSALTTEELLIRHFLESMKCVLGVRKVTAMVMGCVQPPSPAGDGSNVTTPPEEQEVVSRTFVGDAAFLAGWFALLVTHDLPKARGAFETAAAAGESLAKRLASSSTDSPSQPTDGARGAALRGSSSLNDSGERSGGAAVSTKSPEELRVMCRAWVALCTCADTYTSPHQRKTAEVLRQMQAFLVRTAAISGAVRSYLAVGSSAGDPSGANASGDNAVAPPEPDEPVHGSSKVGGLLSRRSRFFAKHRPLLEKIRRGGRHSGQWSNPLVRLVHDCAAYDRSTTSRCRLAAHRFRRLHRSVQVTSSETEGTVRSTRDVVEANATLAWWTSAHAALRSEAMSSEARLKLETSSHSELPHTAAPPNRPTDSLGNPSHEPTQGTSSPSVEATDGASATVPVQPLTAAASKDVQRAVNEAARIDPLNVVALLQQAKVLHDQRRYEAAADLYHEILQESSSSDTSTLHVALVGLGWTHLQRVTAGVSADASVLDLLSSAVAPVALVSALSDVRGAAEIGEGSDKTGRDVLEGASAVLSSDALRSDVHLRRATDLFRRVLATDPCQPWALCGLGRVLTLIPQRPFSSSPAAWAGGLGDSSTDTGSYASHETYMHLVGRQRIATARQHFRAAWKLSGGRCHWAANWLGDCCVAESRRGQGQAMEHYRTCIHASQGTNSWAMTSLGLLLQVNHHPAQSSATESRSGGGAAKTTTPVSQEAVEWFQTALRVDPTNVWAAWALATHLPSAQNQEQLSKCLARFLKGKFR